MKLFMAVLGGNCGNSNIEVHDVRFVVGESIDGCLDQLRREWYGDAKGLHLDSYTEVTAVEGYRIEVSHQPPAPTSPKLFFVNVGGYLPGKFLEFHDIGLYGCHSSHEAKQLALKQLLASYEQSHRDDLYEVDNCIEVNLLDRHYIHLVTDETAVTQGPTWYGYRPIDR